MNFMDAVFLVMLVIGLAIGFFQGTIKLLVAIVAFYVGIILASLYFQSVGLFFQRSFRSSPSVGQITAFAVILLVAFLVLTIAGLYTFRYARVPPSLDFIDRIIGTLLGLFLGALVIGMFAILLRNLFVFQDTAGSLDYPIARFFQSNVRTSILLPFFADYVLPVLYNTLRPVLPRESEIIFRVR